MSKEWDDDKHIMDYYYRGLFFGLFCWSLFGFLMTITYLALTGNTQ